MNNRKAEQNGVVDGDVVGISSSRNRQQHQFSTSTQQRRLTPSEKRLSRVIRAYGFVGAARFIVESGARLVLTALREDVLEWRGVEHIREVDGLRLGWWPKDDIRDPPAFLRHAVRERRFGR